METPHERGRLGEELAARLLKGKGWTILARNFRLGHREIDLIAARGSVVAFVEVKTRKGRAFGHPLESVTALKRLEIERVARAWIARFGRDDQTFRFDAVAVHWRSDGAPTLHHVEDAWRL